MSMDVPKGTYEGPSISIVGHEYCLPTHSEFIVSSKVEKLSTRCIDACDIRGNLLLVVDGTFWNLHKKRVMRATDGTPILTMLQGGQYSYSRWKVYEGEIERSKKKQYNILFTVHQVDTYNFNVFLASKSEKDESDFHVGKSHDDMSCKVYKGNTIIAEWEHSYSNASIKLREKFWVKVCPEVDYAFIMALLSIIYQTLSP